MPGSRRWHWLSLAALSLATGCSVAAFQCEDDAQCTGAGGGVCEDTGFCSFPDPDCDSGRRYGSLAPGDKASACVEASGTTGGSTGPASVSTASASTAGESTLTTTSTTGTGDTAATSSNSTGNSSVCGDGMVEGSEECEPEIPIGIGCDGLGFDGGSLSCTADCRFATDACTACGDGVIEGSEACDRAVPDGMTCADVGFFQGDLQCTPSCTLETTQCTNCGNGALDEGELCDGPATTFVECNDIGFLGGGTRTCASSCEAYETTSCNMLQCGVDATVPLVEACPPPCDACVDGICTVDCSGTLSCSSDTIACPPGLECRVVCDGTAACDGAIIECPAHVGCDVVCSGTNACNSTSVQCSSDGRCSIECQSGTSVCNSAAVTCGQDTCQALCGTDVEGPAVDCGTSCSCQMC